MQWGHEQECCLCDPGQTSTHKFTLAETLVFVPHIPLAVWTEKLQENHRDCSLSPPPVTPKVQPSCLQPTCPPSTGKFLVRSHKALD